MATYQVVSWRDIPLQVRVRGHRKGRLSRSLSERFQQAADAAAMQAGKTESDAYLTEIRNQAWVEREGEPHVVAEAVAAELEAEFSSERLKAMVQNGGRA
jgi:uncharacterized protein (DUF2267 family)